MISKSASGPGLVDLAQELVSSNAANSPQPGSDCDSVRARPDNRPWSRFRPDLELELERDLGPDLIADFGADLELDGGPNLEPDFELDLESDFDLFRVHLEPDLERAPERVLISMLGPLVSHLMSSSPRHLDPSAFDACIRGLLRYPPYLDKAGLFRMCAFETGAVLNRIRRLGKEEYAIEEGRGSAEMPTSKLNIRAG